MTVKRMDNVGIVVEDLDAAVEFFTGVEFESRILNCRDLSNGRRRGKREWN